MVNSIMLAVVVVLLVAGSVAAIIAEQARRHLKAIGAKDACLEKLGGQARDAEKKLRGMLDEGKKISTLGSRSIADTEFLNKIARTAEDNDMAFLIDAVHRGIYEAILTAPTDEMILNAAGKGKGVRMLENTMRNPESIFGGAE